MTANEEVKGQEVKGQAFTLYYMHDGGLGDCVILWLPVLADRYLPRYQ